MQVTSFEVEGKGMFPFDMLRYDQCFPVDGSGVHNMNINTPDLRSVRLISVLPHGLSLTRWQSFGWWVTSAKRHTYS